MCVHVSGSAGTAVRSSKPLPQHGPHQAHAANGAVTVRLHSLRAPCYCGLEQAVGVDCSVACLRDTALPAALAGRQDGLTACKVWRCVARPSLVTEIVTIKQ